MTLKVKDPITLREWIKEQGANNVAKSLKVHCSAVWHWGRGVSLPKSKHLYKIHHLSRGRVSYAEMIETYHGPATSKKRA